MSDPQTTAGPWGKCPKCGKNIRVRNRRYYCPKCDEDLGDAQPQTTRRQRLTVEDLTIDAIAIKATQGHPDHPVTGEEVDFLLSQITRLREENADLKANLDGAAHNRFYDQRDAYFEGMKDQRDAD